MYWTADSRPGKTDRWRCAVAHRESARARYRANAFYRIRQIDRSRRFKALARRRERQLAKLGGQ